MTSTTNAQSSPVKDIRDFATTISKVTQLSNQIALSYAQMHAILNAMNVPIMEERSEEKMERYGFVPD